MRTIRVMAVAAALALAGDAAMVDRAAAQATDPSAAQYGSLPAGGQGFGGMPGMPGSGMGMMGSGQGPMPGMNSGLSAPVTPSAAVARPESWPSASPVPQAQGSRALFAPPPLPGAFPTVDQSNRLGVSISRLPPVTAARSPAATMQMPQAAPPSATVVPQVASLPAGPPPSAALPAGPPPAAASTAAIDAPLPSAVVPDQAAIATAPGDTDVVAAPVQSPVLSEAASQAYDIEGAKVIARVGGSEVIMAGEILGPINELLTARGKEIPASEVEKVRMELLRRRLDQAIQTKLILAEAQHKAGESMDGINKKLYEIFEAKEVPKAMVKLKCKTRQELDNKLREAGNSIERERRAFAERNIAQDWVRQQVKADREITHEQMLAYYLEHATEFDYPAQVRWEQLMVRFSKYPSKEEAFQAIAAAGNRILAGEAFADVARSTSDGGTSADGGAHPWTTKGSLASTAVENALFTLPVGQMSPILEDERSFHIIRVVERKDAGRTQFSEVQGNIKMAIKQTRVQDQIEQYVAKLQKGTKIWTIFDGPDAGDAIPGTQLYTPAPRDLAPAAPTTPSGPLAGPVPPAGGAAPASPPSAEVASPAGPRYR